MRKGYLSHRQTAQAQASLRIHAVLPEPSLLAHKFRELEEALDRAGALAPLDSCTCMFEGTKTA